MSNIVFHHVQCTLTKIRNFGELNNFASKLPYGIENTITTSKTTTLFLKKQNRQTEICCDEKRLGKTPKQTKHPKSNIFSPPLLWDKIKTYLFFIPK